MGHNLGRTRFLPARGGSGPGTVADLRARRRLGPPGAIRLLLGGVRPPDADRPAPPPLTREALHEAPVHLRRIRRTSPGGLPGRIPPEPVTQPSARRPAPDRVDVRAAEGQPPGRDTANPPMTERPRGGRGRPPDDEPTVVRSRCPTAGVVRRRCPAAGSPTVSHADLPRTDATAVGHQHRTTPCSGAHHIRRDRTPPDTP